MILCAALQIKFENKDMIIPCVRHGDGFRILKEFIQLIPDKEDLHLSVEQGFVSTDGSFLDRTAALKHATDCGQLSMSTLKFKEEQREIVLFSEDLY